MKQNECICYWIFQKEASLESKQEKNAVDFLALPYLLIEHCFYFEILVFLPFTSCSLVNNLFSVLVPKMESSNHTSQRSELTSLTSKRHNQRRRESCVLGNKISPEARRWKLWKARALKGAALQTAERAGRGIRDHRWEGSSRYFQNWKNHLSSDNRQKNITLEL